MPKLSDLALVAFAIHLGISAPDAQPSTTAEKRFRDGRSMNSSPAIGATATRIKDGISIDARNLKPKQIVVQEAAANTTKIIEDGTFTLKRNQLAIVQTGTNLVKQEIKGRHNETVPGFALPFQIFSVDKENNTHSLIVCLETGNGLSLHSRVAGYSGSIWIAIQDTENWRTTFDFSVPITVILVGLGLEIEPNRIQFLKANDYRDINVSSLNPTDPVRLNVRFTGLPSEYASATPSVEVTLPVLRPSLEVLATASAIAGFGLEATTISVQARGYLSPAKHEVTLSANGRPADPVLELNEKGFAKTTIRSAGIGKDIVHASTSEASGESRELDYLFPWAFLLSTVLGALAGTTVKQMQSRQSSRRRDTWAHRLILGILVGLAFTVLFAVGLSNFQLLQPSVKTGEALIAAIAFVGAFSGFKLETLKGK